MKKLIPFFLLLCCFSASAANVITISITVTNTAADSATIVVNSSTRTWKNTVATPATQIAVTNSLVATATNLYRHFAAYPWSGNLTLGWSSSNVVTLRGPPGTAMAASSAGSWATVTYVTNTAGGELVVRVPISSEISNANYIASQLIDGINTYATNPILPAATAMAQMMGLTNVQSASGTKTFGVLNATSLNISNTALPSYAGAGYLSVGNGITLGTTNAAAPFIIASPAASLASIKFQSTGTGNSLTNRIQIVKNVTDEDLEIDVTDNSTVTTIAALIGRTNGSVNIGPSKGVERFNVIGGHIALYGDTTNRFRLYPSVVDMFTGSGSPESTYSANKGSFYLDYNTANSKPGYIKASGSGNTGWAPIITGYTNGISPRVCTGSESLDWASISSASVGTKTLTVVGAITNNCPAVMLGWDTNLPPGIVFMSAYVSATNVVTIQLYNTTGGAIDPNAMVVRATVLQP